MSRDLFVPCFDCGAPAREREGKTPLCDACQAGYLGANEDV